MVFIQNIFIQTHYLFLGIIGCHHMRNEIKKKTGIIIDERGNVLDRTDVNENQDDPNQKILDKLPNNDKKDDKKYLSVKDYKPTGNLLYGPDLLEKLEKKLN